MDGRAKEQCSDLSSESRAIPPHLHTQVSQNHTVIVIGLLRGLQNPAGGSHLSFSRAFFTSEKFYEAENKLMSFEFQHSVVDNEDPDCLIALSEGASVSGNATVTTKGWWLLRGLRGFDKSGFLQFPRIWYWIARDAISCLPFPLRKTNHMLDPSPSCKKYTKK